ncbi:hypothetical protein EMCRGX_G027603 [Ephydatia muelleri]|eukprot:Em0020g971a
MAESSTNADSKEQTEEHHEGGGETVSFKVVWKKQSYDITFNPDEKASKLKEHLQTLTGIPPAMMKLMYKGLIKDDRTLREQKVVSSCKMIAVGSTIDEVVEVQPPNPTELKQLMEESAAPKEALSEQKDHKKLIEKGKPDDILPGFKNRHEPLPPSLSGMINKYGTKVRLHFKMELEQLWLGTHERTEKIPLGSIHKVVSEPIKGHEEYHLMGVQLGPTEASLYWIYWVPAQYIEAIKEAVFGKWQFF